MPVIGFLGSASPDLWASRLRAFHLGLNETGFVEGRNGAIEYRWAHGQNERLPALAADVVSRQVSVIAAPGSTPAALVAKAATATIPILFQTAADPVEVGLVTSLNRPGSNLTGVATFGLEVGPKRVELMHEVVPTAIQMALLVNPTSRNLAEATTKNAQAAASALGLKLHIVHLTTEGDFDAVFATLGKQRGGALVIGPDALFTSRSAQLGELTVRHSVPAIYQWREFAEAGGLMSYGGSFTTACVWSASIPVEFSRARRQPICRSSSSRKST
jgi:putative ABC transport system substrate-binding protein